MIISQQQFNNDVKTTMEDFEIPVEEAIEMTIEELKIQGYDISEIDTSSAAVLFDLEKAHILSDQIKECTSFESAMNLWNSVKDDPLINSYLSCFVEEDVLDTFAILATDENLNSFYEIAYSFCSYSQDPQLVTKPYFYALITRGLQQNNASCFPLLSLLLAKSDPPRVLCSYHKMDGLLLEWIQHSISPESLDCLIYLVKEDAFSIETRNARIRQLLENESIFSLLTTQLSTHCNNKELTHRLCLLLSKIVVDEPGCKKLGELGIVALLKQCLDLYVEEMNVLYALFKLLTALARADSFKMVLFEMLKTTAVSSLLTPSKTVVIPHMLVIAMIEFLSTISLRNNSIVQSLVEDYRFDMQCFSFMKQFERDRKIQLHGCFLLRMCVSCSEESESRLVSAGIVDHIQSIMTIDNDLRIACVQLKRSLKSIPFSV